MNRRNLGFTTVELMTVVLIIGILLAIAVPTYQRTQSRSLQTSCFANQRTLEAVAYTWLSLNPSAVPGDLAGTVNADHPVLVDRMITRSPTCPSAPEPADALRPTTAEGAYVFDDSGHVTACAFGHPAAHGHF